MVLSVVQTIGLAQQPTLGTPVDPVTHLFPVTSVSIQEEFEQLLDNGHRGKQSMDYNAVQGVQRVNISIDGLIQPNGATGMPVGMLLRNLLGSGGSYPVTQISATGVYKHWRRLGTTKEYLTLEHDNGLSGTTIRQIEGCRCKELTFSWNAAEGLMSYSASLVGRSVVLVTATDLSAQIATLEDPFAGWQGVINVNGTAAFTRLLSSEWTLSRSERLIYPATNSQSYSDIFLEELEVTASLVFHYSVTTDIAMFRAKTQGELTNLFEYGTGGTLRGFGLSGILVDFGDGPAEIDSSAGTVTLALTGRSLHSATNGALGVDLDARDTDTDTASQDGPIETVTEETASSAY